MKPNVFIQSILWTRPCNSEPLKQSKSSHLKMFFKRVSRKNFTMFTGKRMCWGLFAINLWAFKSATFLKRDYNTGFSCGYCELFKCSFFYNAPPMAACDSPTIVQQSHLGCLFFDFVPPRAFNFDQKITQNVAQIIIYYHFTKQFHSCLNWLITCFQFRNMFWKNISCFRFCSKTYTTRCTNNYVISRVKKHFLSARCGCSSAFNLRTCFWKQSNAVWAKILNW